MNIKLSNITCYLAVLLTMIVADVKSVDAQTQGEESPFVVRNIQIDVTAENAKAARDKAFREAQTASLPILMEQLSASGYDTYALKQTDPKVIANAITDFEIANEKISAVRYKGDFVFRYDENILNQYVYTGHSQQHNQQIPIAGQYQEATTAMNGQAPKDNGRDRVLVLPFFQSGSGQMVLWEGYNPWKNLWLKKASPAIFAPIGDLSDIRDISAQQALTYNPENLARMSTRYGADRIVILIGTHENATLPQSLSQPANGQFRVSMYDTARGRPEFVNDILLNESNYQSFGDALTAGYNRSVEMIYGLNPVRAIGSLQQIASHEGMDRQDSLSTQYASGEQTSKGIWDRSSGTASGKFQARIEYTSMQEWMRAQKTIRSVQSIKNVNVLSMSPKQAEITIEHYGQFEDVATDMTKAGYHIQPTSKAGRYMITSSRRSAYNQNGGVVYR